MLKGCHMFYVSKCRVVENLQVVRAGVFCYSCACRLPAAAEWDSAEFLSSKWPATTWHNFIKTGFHHEDDWVLAQLAQWGCAVSILADLEKLSGRGVGQRAQGVPAGAESLDQMASSGPSNLGFCDEFQS